MQPGKYLVLKHAYWMIDEANFIVITSYYAEEDAVYYYYPNDKENRIRYRRVEEFEDVILVKSSPLIEELF